MYIWTKTKKTLSIATFLISFVLFMCSDCKIANAQGYNIEVSPAKVNLEVKPGETYIQTFRVGNFSGATKKLYFYTQDFTISNESGTPLFLDNVDPNSNTYSLTKWVELPQTEVEIEDEEFAEIEVKITVPEDAEAGGHYAAFFTQTERPEGGSGASVGSIGRIGALMLLNVPGDVDENINLVKFLTDKGIYFEDNPKITFTTVLKNKGNVHAIPTGIIFVSGGNNFKNRNLIFNQQQGAILPDTPDREITTSFDVVKSGTFPPIGKFNANLVVSYGTQNYEVNGHTEFWLIPIKFTVLVLLALLALAFVLWRTVVSYRKERE